MLLLLLRCAACTPGVWSGQLVAVKVIKHSELAEPRVREEVEISTSFVHPNVVRSLYRELHQLDPKEIAIMVRGADY